MNDLSGLSWDTAPSNPSTTRNGTLYPNFQAAPSPSLSRQPTPLPGQQSGRSTPLLTSNPPSKPAANDSFSSLLTSSAAKKTNPLSLQERQKQLLEEKGRQITTQHNGHQEHYRADDAHFWEGLGGGRSSLAQAGVPVQGLVYTVDNRKTTIAGNDDDILAAFNAAAPVDSSSYFPPPRVGSNGVGSTDSREHSLHRQASPISNPHMVVDSQQPSFDDDDDTFGLGQIARRPQTTIPQTSIADDEDILGMLGRPVSEIASRTNHDRTARNETNTEEPKVTKEVNPHDAAIAELVDMGFPVENARRALETTSTGVDIQAAVGWLLNQAHEESRNSSRTRVGTETTNTPRGRASRANGTDQEGHSGEGVPAWMRNQNGPMRQDSRSPASADRDVTRYAAEVRTTLMKSANSLWKTSQKTVQKAVSDFQEADGPPPRWMKESQAPAEPQATRRPPRNEQPRAESNITDEAMMLESGRSTPVLRPDPREHVDPRAGLMTAPLRRQQSPLHTERESREQQRPPRYPSPLQKVTRPPERPAERLSRQVVEEQTTQAYISPARRKKAPNKVPEVAEPSLDIFASAEVRQAASQPVPAQRLAIPRSQTTPPTPARPKISARSIPLVSSVALATSSAHRQKGTEAFKRGDYAEAQVSYTHALSALPSQHPITIILLCNRALTNIKTGDPKAATVDAVAALGVIGPSRGEAEFISLGEGESEKPMKEYFGKALMRKAEALEHMEKWSDAATVWREAVEAGVGGNVSIQGRNRCEKASSSHSAPSAPPSRPASAPVPNKATPPRRAPIAVSSGLADINGNEAEAVKRLRAANTAAAAASDEAFALNDVVTARLDGWKTGKEGNLRALLASLDSVLWQDAGWNKVGMGDLVMPNRVKVIYMKAIAKCHPDKIPQTATTEQRLIAAAVFATLNEAWDRFKRDNGL